MSLRFELTNDAKERVIFSIGDVIRIRDGYLYEFSNYRDRKDKDTLTFKVIDIIGNGRNNFQTVRVVEADGTAFCQYQIYAYYFESVSRGIFTLSEID